MDSGVSFAELVAHRRGSASPGRSFFSVLEPVPAVPFLDVCDPPRSGSDDPVDLLVDISEWDGEEAESGWSAVFFLGALGREAAEVG